MFSSLFQSYSFRLMAYFLMLIPRFMCVSVCVCVLMLIRLCVLMLMSVFVCVRVCSRASPQSAGCVFVTRLCLMLFDSSSRSLSVNIWYVAWMWRCSIALLMTLITPTAKSLPQTLSTVLEALCGPIPYEHSCIFISFLTLGYDGFDGTI